MSQEERGRKFIEEGEERGRKEEGEVVKELREEEKITEEEPRSAGESDRHVIFLSVQISIYNKP
jgi:hypothetical protein